MFLDEARIEVTGGPGGRGCVSWRREKYISKGGPNGGDGGSGGSIFIIADENTDTLSDFTSTKKFAAQKGRFGSGSNKNGRDGEDLWLRVPPGTTITDTETSEVLADLKHHGDTCMLVKGGRGGFGNAHFKSSVRQTPDFAELGEPGDQRTVDLDLKLVADVGIIGFPSVGKSTLISVISAAKPKIAAYPFTTLVPNLGVVLVDDRSYVVCDVPGLIEGASEGKGLGDTFLRHIERCGLLLHMLDISRALEEGNTVNASLLAGDYSAIRKELEAYSPSLSKKKEYIILNKSDLIAPEILATLIEDLKKMKIEVIASISAATTSGTKELTSLLLPIVLQERKDVQRASEEVEPELVVLQPHLTSPKMGSYRVEKEEEKITVHGKRLEQLVKMTDFSSEGGTHRFRNILKKIGLLKVLQKETSEKEIPIYIGEIRIDEYL